jgi:hypothetical protein
MHGAVAPCLLSQVQLRLLATPLLFCLKLVCTVRHALPELSVSKAMNHTSHVVSNLLGDDRGISCLPQLLAMAGVCVSGRGIPCAAPARSCV